ncbi:MAG: 3-dehydroquinate synthase [Clostridia bacterium]
MKIAINLEHKSYDILMEKDIIKSIRSYFDFDRKVLIITDKGVPASYLDTVFLQCPHAYTFVIPMGEQSKSLDMHKQISEFMLEKGFSRKDLIIALGGGVVGDLSGFVASTYMRGIEYISIPTTALSQIDSSIGGKTAVNLGAYKNMIGAFHHPSKVFIDTNTLKTLPRRHLFNGLVEALKAGLIYDKELFDLFLDLNFEKNLDAIIYKSLLVKKAVVEEDEKEQNVRKILNFGHTIGHGIESFYNFEYLHGECVALGMIPMIRDEEIRNKVVRILSKMDIKSQIEYDIDEVYQIVKHDKKATNDMITIAVVSSLGRCHLENISFNELLSIMRGY